MKKLFDSFKNYLWKHHSQDEGKMLIYVGALGWVFSSLAQTFAIVTNSKISKKEKSFLIPQEIFDGILNVGLYFGVTQLCKKGVEKLMTTGKLQIMEAGKNANAKYLGPMGVFTAVAGSVLACNVLTPISRNYLGALYQKQHLKKYPETYNPIKNQPFKTVLPGNISSVYSKFIFPKIS